MNIQYLIIDCIYMVSEPKITSQLRCQHVSSIFEYCLGVSLNYSVCVPLVEGGFTVLYIALKLSHVIG